MNTLKKIGNILIIVCALFYVVSFYSFTLAEESQAAKRPWQRYQIRFYSQRHLYG